MNRSRWSRLAVLLAVAALVAAGAYLWSRSGSKPPPYLTAKVERGDIVVAVSANGTLNPVTLVNVGTQVSGTVRRLHVDYNSRVAKGEVLLELDNSTYSAAVRQSEASLRSQSAQAELAEANEHRAVDLFGKGYIAQQELDQARQLARSARAQRDLVKAQLDRDRANLGYTVIRSPVAGVVVSREVDVGQTVAASFQTPTLFKIAQDLSKMQIDSNFAEADIGRIRVGESVRFNVDAFADRVFEGRVKQVRLNPTTVQNVVTYDVVVAVENPDERLLPGMTAYVSVVLSEKHDVLKIPNSALRFRPPGAAAEAPSGGRAATATGPGAGGPASQRPAGGRRSGERLSKTVYVMRDGTPVAVTIQLGGTDRRFTEVIAGALEVGDEIATGSSSGSGAQPPPAGAPRVRMF